ncbi:MAG TPA: hypothetical protein VJ728_03130 [Candidatus Binataceae bacterium]|nr:hypothetical protein [Candidatus Binataceae bacterium]
MPEQAAYVAALIPLVSHPHRLARPNLRRLYQLFAFMEMPAGERGRLLQRLQGDPQLLPELVPFFRNRQVRHSLAEEVEYFAGNSPSREALDYVRRVRVRLNVTPRSSRTLSRLLEKMTELENRAAMLLGKRGHVVRLDDRRLEIFKKSVAAVGVPSAVLFPLGTIGLSAEGVTSGLIALGGGFILPAGIAIVTGVGAAVALGITTKRLLDLVMPTIDADRASIDVEQLRQGVVELERLLDDAMEGDQARGAAARQRIARIIEQIAPLTEAQRTRIETALEHARILGQRYLDNLQQDNIAFATPHPALAHELQRLFEIDRLAISAG